MCKAVRGTDINYKEKIGESKYEKVSEALTKTNGQRYNPLSPPQHKTLLVILFIVDGCSSIPKFQFQVRHPKARGEKTWRKEDLEPRG